MAGYQAPILIMTGLSFANHWYATHGQIDLKIPVAGGIAYVLASMLSEIPGVEPIVGGIAWVALAAAIVVPVSQGHQSILSPLLSIANGAKTHG